MSALTTCPVCGHACRVVGSDEGTQHYEPVHLLADTPSVEPRACGCPATDANGFARTCTLPLDHAGMHSARDTAGTPTGEATWLWNGPHGLAYRESKP